MGPYTSGGWDLLTMEASIARHHREDEHTRDCHVLDHSLEADQGILETSYPL